MKKVFLATLLAIGTIAFAQERKMKHDDLTPEQKTELRVKQMTLDLDLNKSQQEKVKALFLEQENNRKQFKADRISKKENDIKPSKEEMYKKRSQMLDQQIEFKAKMKNILNEKQMVKWEEMQSNRKMHSKERKMQHRDNEIKFVE